MSSRNEAATDETRDIGSSDEEHPVIPEVPMLSRIFGVQRASAASMQGSSGGGPGTPTQPGAPPPRRTQRQERDRFFWTLIGNSSRMNNNRGRSTSARPPRPTSAADLLEHERRRARAAALLARYGTGPQSASRPSTSFSFDSSLRNILRRRPQDRIDASVFGNGASSSSGRQVIIVHARGERGADAPDGTRPSAHDGSRSGVHDGNRPSPYNGNRPGTHDGNRASAHNGIRACPYDGNRTGAHVGNRAGSHDGNRPNTHDGIRTSPNDGNRSGAQYGIRAGTHDGHRAGAFDGNRPSVHDGNRADAHDANRPSAHDGNRPNAHDGNRAGAHDGNRPSAHDGNEAGTHDGDRASAHDVNRPSSHDGNRASAHDGFEDGAYEGNRASAHDEDRPSAHDGFENSADDGNRASADDDISTRRAAAELFDRIVVPDGGPPPPMFPPGGAVNDYFADGPMQVEEPLNMMTGALELEEEILEVEPEGPSGPDDDAEPTETVDGSAETSPQARGTKRKRESITMSHDTRYLITDDTQESHSTLNQSILRLLECPVCLDWMEPPITQCRRGHLVCGSCRRRLDTCPVCRTAFSSVRNRAMEDVAGILRYPCRHGCGRSVRAARRHKHEASCASRRHACPLPACRGAPPMLRAKLRHHCQNKHPESFLSGASQRVSLAWGGERALWVVGALGALFLVRAHAARAWGVLLHAALLGPVDQAARYTYEVTVTGRHNARRFSYRRATHSDLDNFALVSSHQDCFHLSPEKCLHYMRHTNGHPDQDNTLDLTITFAEVEPEEVVADSGTAP